MTNCPTCKHTFDPSRVPGGMCPACLMAGGDGANEEDDTLSMAAWLPPSIEKLQPLLPGYELLEFIGRGGMGAVYKARQPALDRLVAIKLLPAATAEMADSFAERFKNEARLLARMSHPSIVHVYDFGTLTDGSSFIVMEYVNGTDVARMVAGNGKLSPQHAASITADVCSALHYAHEAGIVHRDIKPANILVNRLGQVKVADFGLAKAQDPGLPEITRTRFTLGTPEFLAPESLTAGMTVDHRADLYAVGVMLYNMLTGQIPRGVFPPASQTTSAPRAFDHIISKAMQANPEYRYQTAVAMQRDVEMAGAPPVMQQSPAWGKRWAWAAVAAAALIAGISVIKTNRSAQTDLPRQTDSANLTPTAALEAALRKANPKLTTPPKFRDHGNGEMTVQIEDATIPVSLEPLRECKLPITHLNLNGSTCPDLSPCLGLPIRSIVLDVSPNQDFRQISGIPLQELMLRGPHLDTIKTLEGFQLRSLSLDSAPIADISPLRKMSSLEVIALRDCKVDSLDALRELRNLDSLILQKTRVRSLHDLKGVPLRLLELRENPIDDFKPVLEIQGLEAVVQNDVSRSPRNVAGVPVPFESEMLRLIQALRATNPGCPEFHPETRTSAGTPRLFILPDGGWQLSLADLKEIRDLSALKGQPIEHLRLDETSVEDLTPLKGIALRNLFLDCRKPMDLSPLESMPLQELVLSGSGLTSLQSLARPTLRHLHLNGTGVTDLTPLKLCPQLVHLRIGNSPVSDLSPLADLRIEHLTINDIKVTTLDPLMGMPLLEIQLKATPVADLSPLLKMEKLERIWCDAGHFDKEELKQHLGK